ncbi:hypothetical protein CBR_g50977 [Chara braunii]|uniref:Integrase catalytic domain-containing protein n=1 Tax=Chara braunii TaxID=69332 RepID=A0A388M847_CHABU|nr:hypothetical protein CBR_g50977 [Chara braunii]|eukprot:GBG90632.1 hypothetical protein CBR_g50977 [Chara braunii]
MTSNIGDSSGKVLTLDDLIEAMDKRERTPRSVPKVDTFHFNGERVSEWLDLVEQALVGVPDETKFKRILQYVLHKHHPEVQKVVDDANGDWAKFREGMQRKYRLGDGLLTMADLESMNRDDFTTIGPFLQEFKKKARKVEQHQVRLQRQKRKERDAAGTPGVKKIITDVLAGLDPVIQRKVMAAVQEKGKGAAVEEATQEGWEEEGPVPPHLTKAQPCGNYEVVTCRNTGPRSLRNRPNPGSFTIEESEDAHRRLRAEPEEEVEGEAFSLSLSDVGKAMDIVATHETADPDAIQALREQVLEYPQDQEWTLGEDQEEVVANMKEEFREGGLVLGAPDYDATETRPFIVETDAGPTTLGGVLIQADITGKERPLRFESRTLCTPERNYSQFKRETLAVLHCLRIFRNYIFGRRFILRVDPTTLAFFLRNYVPSDPTVARWLTYIWMFNFELERIPGNKNRADGLSRINWDRQDGEAVEDTPPVDGFLDQDEDIRLHINKWSPRVPSCVGHPIWHAPKGYERKAELVFKPFEEEDPWGGRDVQCMTNMALAGDHCMVDEVLTIEEGPDKVKCHEELIGGMYLLINTLLQESLDLESSLNPAEGRDTALESQDDEFEEGEIKEAFLTEEYDGIYLELGLLLSCEMRDRDASHRAQMMRDRYLVRDGHLFIRRKVGNPRRVVCGRNCQIDIIAALHDVIAGGHQGVTATYAKISELYYWDGMMEMVGKFYQSCVPCQEQSRLRPGEPLHPRLEREVGAVVHLDLLFMPLGDHGYNYIFDARDNLSGFVDGRAIRTKTGPVLVSCIEEYYLRYPFVREFVMDRGSEFTCQEVQDLLSRYGLVANYTTAAHPQANAPVERGHSTITALLAKWTEGKPSQWPRYLRAAFFVENITVKRTTKYAPATLWYGRHATFPIESFLKTWRRQDLEEAGQEVVRSLSDRAMRRDQRIPDRGAEWNGVERLGVRDKIEEVRGQRRAMPRGGRGTRPPRRPAGASGGHGRHGPYRRASTPVYNDGDIELFMNEFWGHADHMGWTVTRTIERLRGVGRFTEPIAQIRREARTRSEVEARMQELRPSPVGPDGRPIRLEIGNADDFIPAFEQFMQGHAILRSEWMTTLPLWTRKAERPLARQIRGMARDWDGCKAHLRAAFRQPEPPRPRVERPLRSCRQREPEPAEDRTSRRGRKALARREEETVPEAEERGEGPECELGPVEFHRYTGTGLGGSPQHTQREVPASGGSLQELEAHLDAAQWREPPMSERRIEAIAEVPQEDVPDPEQEEGPSAPKDRIGDEIIEVEEDTPPQGPAVGLRLGSLLKSPPDTRKKVQREEVSISVPEIALSPTGMEASEAEGASLRREADSLIDSHLAAHALEQPNLEEVIPVELPREPGKAEVETSGGNRGCQEVLPNPAEVLPNPAEELTIPRERWNRGCQEEIRQEGQRLEAAEVLPNPPPPYKPYGLREMWGKFLTRHGEGLTTPGKAEVETSQRADEYLDQRIRSVSKTSFDRYMMLEADLRGKELKEAGLESRLGTIEAKVRGLRALVTSQAATILELKQQLHDGRNGVESNRPGERRQPGHGVSEQPAVAEPQQEAPMGRVILEPEEAEAKRKAEREAFEFRAPTELAVLPTMAADPAMPPSLEERLPSDSDEPPQGSTGGSLDVLLEAVHSMQEDAGLFSPESKLEEPLESEMGGAMEGIIAGRPQGLDTPDYEPEGARAQPEPSPRESEAGSERPRDVPQCHELDGEARETPSPAGPQRKKKRPRKSFDSTCFYCTKEEHSALQCLKFLKD